MKFFSISHHGDVAEMFAEYDMEMTEDQSDFFSHVNDWETFVFYVINGETVVTVDGVDNCVMQVESLGEFYASSIEHYLDSEV